MICAGGTGGGVYPALAVLEALNAERADVQTLWVGGEGGVEARLVERAGVPFKAIPAAGLHGVGLRHLPGNLLKLARGAATSRRILHAFRPDAIFFTGGYVAVPMALAGMQVPTLLYVPDVEPGLALRTLARFADRIAVTAEESRRYFRRRARLAVTGYPVRPGLARWTRPEARRTLGLPADGPVLLAFGGSKGARSLNNAVLANLPALLDLADLVHVTGELDWPAMQEKAKSLNAAQAARYHAFAYLHEEMGAALAAADLAISRAGASALGEYPLFGLPAILVPYPYAWRYQKVNADFLTGRGAALLLEDAQLQESLLPAVKNLLADPSRLDSMRAAMRSLSRPDAASVIGRLVLDLAGKRR
ncbi:MAG: UDP-N-acetylglucosamine--N-acetylmuramyl-(pentapeptide) pyrophosphoryl-undecaprenol N-acetylglucosamine transferase [Anaerolineaceae bacterium]|nr:MAG: UDP-N-acetylglucosamine--N-acetylmuramyl-(pentapeptide) pyrophosphoryl-undecaprenol N-acetylglucosamine transferase [Anaerolineaceae bacterium]